MINKLITGITTLVTTALLVGCSLPLTPSEMIKPPMMGLKKEEIKQAAEQFMPKGAKFTVPKQSEQTGSIVQIDLNNDGTDEIAVFYKDEASIGMLLLEQVGSKWQLKDQITGYGNNIDYAGFYDMDGDKQLEVLFGGEGYGQDNKLIIYKLVGKKYKEFSRLDYASFSVGDLEGDGKLEIASILRIDKIIPVVRLQVFSLGDKTLQQDYETEFENGGYPEQVLIGAAAKGLQGIFVDMGVGAHSAVTKLLIRENGEFKNIFNDVQTFKAYSLPSKDINNDGIVEIGMLIAPPETEESAMAGIPWVNNWYQWDGESGLMLEPVREDYSNYFEGYQFIIPENWRSKYTINKEADENSAVESVHFTYLAAEKKKAELLALYHLPKEEWQKQEPKWQNNNETYVVLGENSRNMLVAKLPQNNAVLSGNSLKEYKEMLLDKESIKKYFANIIPLVP